MVVPQSSDFHAGDLVGFRTRGVFAAAIRLGQRISGIKHYDITHIAVVVEGGPDPLIIQAVRKINEVRLSSYGDTEHVVIPSPLVPFDPCRSAAVTFAKSELGRKYGVMSVISRAWNTITPKWVRFGINRSGDMDCSAFGTRFFEHQGITVPWPDPWQVFPGQLADEYIKEPA